MAKTSKKSSKSTKTSKSANPGAKPSKEPVCKLAPNATGDVPKLTAEDIKILRYRLHGAPHDAAKVAEWAAKDKNTIAAVREIEAEEKKMAAKKKAEAKKKAAAKKLVAKKSIAKKPVAKKPATKKFAAKKSAAKKSAAKKPSATKPAVDLKAMAADVKGWLVEYFPSPNQKLSDAALQKSINAKLKSFPKIAATNKLLSVSEVTARFVAKLTEDEKSMLRKRFAA